MEQILNYIHRDFISLKDDDMKKYYAHANKVMQELISTMKNTNPLFKKLFKRICGAGSYFDGLKVGKPEEFDMDIVLRFPVNYADLEIITDGAPPGFLKISMKKEIENLRQHPQWTEVYRHMDKWIDEKGFLLQSQFHSWIEEVVISALNTYKSENELKGNHYHIIVENEIYKTTVRKSGPAMTFQITVPQDNIKVDIDFVPVLEFTHPKWPPKPTRCLSSELMNAKKISWLIVPKPNKGENVNHTFWRISFNEQEKYMINDKGKLKPVCRILKKYRDTEHFKIASYYLKTLFLWEVENQPRDFWNLNQELLLKHMLKQFEKHLKLKEIPYFWDKRCNLLASIKETTLSHIENRVTILINDIDKNGLHDPCIIARNILLEEELVKLMKKRETGLICVEDVSPQAVKVARVNEKSSQNAITETQISLQDKASFEETISKTAKTMTKMDKAIIIKPTIGGTEKVENPSSAGSHCWNNIETRSEYRETFYEEEIKLLQRKYLYEIELIKMKKENEKLKQEVLKEKLLYYKEKRGKLQLK